MRFAVALAFFAGAAQADPILVMGDSIMDWNRATGRSVSHALAEELGRDVRNLSVSGARIFGRGFRSIPGQFRGSAWSWIVLDGGANDLQTCGCNRCERMLDRLISGDAGAIPTLLARLQGSGANVLWMVYYGPNGRGGAFDPCADELAELDARVAALAANTDGLHFVDAGDVLGRSAPDDYHRDNVHPAPRESAKIAALLAAKIEEVEG